MFYLMLRSQFDANSQVTFPPRQHDLKFCFAYKSDAVAPALNKRSILYCKSKQCLVKEFLAKISASLYFIYFPALKSAELRNFTTFILYILLQNITPVLYMCTKYEVIQNLNDEKLRKLIPETEKGTRAAKRTDRYILR